jgi:hypothetical protein
MLIKNRLTVSMPYGEILRAPAFMNPSPDRLESYQNPPARKTCVAAVLALFCNIER